MKKLFLLAIATISIFGVLSAQRGGTRNNHNQGNWDNDRDNVYGQNPYNDPNYYPNPNNGRCGSPPPPPCYRPPVVVVPPTYCAPVVINPYPMYRPYHRPIRGHYRAYGYGRGHGRRW